jgi:hypothetical protein
MCDRAVQRWQRRLQLHVTNRPHVGYPAVRIDQYLSDPDTAASGARWYRRVRRGHTTEFLRGFDGGAKSPAVAWRSGLPKSFSLAFTGRRTWSTRASPLSKRRRRTERDCRDNCSCDARQKSAHAVLDTPRLRMERGVRLRGECGVQSWVANLNPSPTISMGPRFSTRP